MENALALFGVYCFCSFIGVIAGNRFTKPKLTDLIDIFATGVAIIILNFHLLGAIGVLNWNTFFGGTALISGLLWLKAKNVIDKAQNYSSEKQKRIISKKEIAIMTSCGAIVIWGNVLMLRWNFSDSGGYDSLAYHMYAPIRAINSDHVLNAQLLIPNAGLPLGVDVLHPLFIQLGGGVRVPAVNYLLILLALFSATLTVKGASVRAVMTATICIMLLCASPITYGQLSSDIALLAFVAVILRRRYENKNKTNKFDATNMLYLSALALIKPFAILFVLAYLLSIKHATMVKRLIMFSITALPLLLWSIKNYIDTRNPFYPMFQSAFKGLGYESRLMTVEQDVRRSFAQLANFLQSNFNINPFSPQNDSTFYALILFGLVCCVALTMFGRTEDEDRAFQYLISTVGLVMLFVAGPVYRYLMFILLTLLILAFNRPVFWNYSKIALVIRTTMGFALAYSALALMSIGHRGNDMNQPMFGQDNSGRISEVANVLRSEIRGDDSVCVMGDGRLLSFWPIATEALPMDTRNPFINQSVSSLIQVDQALGELKCDSVLFFDGWGYPEFVDEDLLARWQDYASAREVFEDSGWKFAQIN